MNKGPRIYNALSDEERIARLQRKAARKVKEVHRVRRNRIVAIFAIIFVFFGIQLIMVHVQTNRINSQVEASKVQLDKINQKNKKLEAQSNDLKDPSYVGKMIRYKFYYSKPGEAIYSIPEKEDNN
ncbi:septum formation initiator family protein [uncultured Lactobacillus sp.]|uniref:FtsB family cell division protein n=1 Tax=uncultured Lactobacillus sp. TaxID=153152 RepID=UPI00261A1D40|nr:septum formation initiator family protein [uncultured Lactobacillus sp.]